MAAVTSGVSGEAGVHRLTGTESGHPPHSPTPRSRRWRFQTLNASARSGTQWTLVLAAAHGNPGQPRVGGVEFQKQKHKGKTLQNLLLALMTYLLLLSPVKGSFHSK